MKGLREELKYEPCEDISFKNIGINIQNKIHHQIYLKIHELIDIQLTFNVNNDIFEQLWKMKKIKGTI